VQTSWCRRSCDIKWVFAARASGDLQLGGSIGDVEILEISVAWTLAVNIRLTAWAWVAAPLIPLVAFVELPYKISTGVDGMRFEATTYTHKAVLIEEELVC
jgi:hypothetical protein